MPRTVRRTRAPAESAPPALAAAPPAPPVEPPPEDGLPARMLARRHTVAAIATLAELMQPAAGERLRLAAALALLERGWGKVATGSEEDEPAADAVDPEEARARLAERIEQLAAAIDGAEGTGA